MKGEITEHHLPVTTHNSEIHMSLLKAASYNCFGDMLCDRKEMANSPDKP